MQGNKLSDPSRDRNVQGDETVPLMRENTLVEKEYKKNNTVQGLFLLNEKYEYEPIVTTLFTASLILATAFALGLTITGAWAIIQCMVFFSITTQASISVIIISVLVIIVGVLMIVGIVGCVLCVKFERTSYYHWHFILLSITPILSMIIFVVSLISLGIAAALLIPSLPESIGISAHTSLFTISDHPQGASDAWDVAQNTLRCCGAVDFSDYEHIFNNYSVPVSCCNTTNPLVNETTCPDIVRDTNVANATELIYTEGCVHQLVSYYHYILGVIAGVSIIIGAVPIICGLCPLSLMSSLTDDEVCSCCNKPGVSSQQVVFKCFSPIIGLILLLGVGFIAVSIWALVRNQSLYYTITASASDNVTVLSVLLITAGGLLTGIGVCHIVKAKFTNLYHKSELKFIAIRCCELWFVCLCVLPMVILALIVGILAAGMSGPTIMELSTTLHKYLDDQTVQDAWNNIQENMECCGVSNFTDYELVFSNFSVPVSCCNTTNPLASECPDIVRNSQQMINQTGLIYSDVSADILPLAAVLIWLWTFSYVGIKLHQEIFWKKPSTDKRKTTTP